MSDMMRAISETLRATDELKGVVIKPYVRPESLAKDKASVVIVPLSSPMQSDFASDRPQRMRFSYQINVEASSKNEVITLAIAVKEALLSMGFLQEQGGLDEYFPETGRYVDARHYRGYSPVYQTDY